MKKEKTPESEQDLPETEKEKKHFSFEKIKNLYKYHMYIFVDGLSSFRITSSSISAFPSAILSFPDVAFTVCSSFCHLIHLLFLCLDSLTG